MNDRRRGHALAWILAALLLAANVAGYALDLYAAAWWFDRVLHAATLFAITFFLGVVALGGALDGLRPAVFLLLLAALGVAIGALWEVAEWAYDLVAPGDVIKGKHDTVLDIIMDTLGSAAAALLALSLRPARTPRHVP